MRARRAGTPAGRVRPRGGRAQPAESAQVRRGPGAVDLGRALGFYDKVAGDAALKVLERWRRDPQYLFAIKTIEQSGSRPGGGAEFFGPASDGDGTR